MTLPTFKLPRPVPPEPEPVEQSLWLIPVSAVSTMNWVSRHHQWPARQATLADLRAVIDALSDEQKAEVDGETERVIAAVRERNRLRAENAQLRTEIGALRADRNAWIDDCWQAKEALRLLADDGQCKREEIDRGLVYCLRLVLDKWQGASDEAAASQVTNDNLRRGKGLAQIQRERDAAIARAERLERELRAWVELAAKRMTISDELRGMMPDDVVAAALADEGSERDG